MRYPSRVHNFAELILDGSNYFGRLKSLFVSLLAEPPAADTYLRLAFWEIEHGLRLPSVPADLANPDLAFLQNRGRTIVHWIEAIADKGHRVDVIMWCPKDIDVKFDGNLSTHIYNTNQDTARRLGLLTPGNGGSINVLSEIYGGRTDYGKSVHQKIVLVSVQGVLTALLGGMNLASFYYDDDQHSATLNGGMGGIPLGHTIHDTAVQLQGAAAYDVEAEWLRRYEKRFEFFSLHRGVGTTDKGNETLQTIPKSQLQTQPTHRPNQPTRMGPYTVQIATTNSEGMLGQTHIRDLLIEKIKAAQQYIYLEGYMVSDPKLLAALRARQQAAPNVKLIVMVPKPFAQNPYPFDYLNYISFVKLALDTATEVRVKGNWVARANCTKWKLDEKYSGFILNDWMQNDTFDYTLNTGQSDSVKLIDIQDFRGGIRFYSPMVRNGHTTNAIYIHSKLALIDNSTAVIGSANFTYRSQEYDGEISAFIGDDVTDFCQDLWRHWGLSGHYLAFDQDVAAFNPLAAAHWVAPLQVADYPKVTPFSPNSPFANVAKVSHEWI